MFCDYAVDEIFWTTLLRDNSNINTPSHVSMKVDVNFILSGNPDSAFGHNNFTLPHLDAHVTKRLCNLCRTH